MKTTENSSIITLNYYIYVIFIKYYIYYYYIKIIIFIRLYLRENVAFQIFS